MEVSRQAMKIGVRQSRSISSQAKKKNTNQKVLKKKKLYTTNKVRKNQQCKTKSRITKQNQANIGKKVKG